MTLSEYQPLLGPLATVFGAISTVATGVFWLFKRHIKHLEEKILVLNKNCKEFSEQIEMIRSNEVVAVQGRKKSEIELAESIRERNVAKEQVAELNGQLGIIQSQLLEKSKAVDELEKKYESILAKGQDIYKKCKQFEAKCVQLEVELACRDSANSELLQSAAQASSKRTGLEEECRKAIEQRDNARAELKDFRKLVKDVSKLEGQIWQTKVPAGIPSFMPLKERRTPIIAIMNLKGGVGKTTITANLGGYLGAERGKRVLLIDLDHQRSLTQMLLSRAVRKQLRLEHKSVQHFFLNAISQPAPLLNHAYHVAGMENCRIIANHDAVHGDNDVVEEGDVGLDDLEMQLMLQWQLSMDERLPDVRFLLRSGLHTAAVREGLDYVFLDCPPRFTTASVNALAAADFLVIPSQPESVASRSIVHFFPRLRSLANSGVSPDLQILGILGNMSAGESYRDAEYERLVDMISESKVDWPTAVTPFRTVIKRSLQYSNATSNLEVGTKLKLAYSTSRTEYEELAIELTDRINAYL